MWELYILTNAWGAPAYTELKGHPGCWEGWTPRHPFKVICRRLLFAAANRWRALGANRKGKSGPQPQSARLTARPALRVFPCTPLPGSFPVKSASTSSHTLSGKIALFSRNIARLYFWCSFCSFVTCLINSYWAYTVQQALYSAEKD